MNKQDFIKNINNEVSEENIVNFTYALCEQETVNPPGNEYLCNEALYDIFRKIGIKDIKKYEKEENRSNLIGTIKSNHKGKKLAIVCHTDVVPVRGQNWKGNPFQPEIKDGKIYARGTADNKGPFASILEGVRLFNKLAGNIFNGEIMIISAADEEQGSELGIKYLFNEVGITCDMALIPDGGEFSEAVYGEMGIYTLEFNSKGKAYHGSMPEEGYNAILPLTYMTHMLGGYDWEGLKGIVEFDPVVLNIGVIEGGTALNIVPDNAKMSAMWRYPVGVKHEQIRKIVEQLLKKVKEIYPEAEISYKQIHLSMPFISKKEGELISQTLKSAEELNLPTPKLRVIRAETVAKYIAQSCGAEVLVNGPQDGSVSLMHAPDEYIEIQSLVNFAKYYALILYNLLVK